MPQCLPRHAAEQPDRVIPAGEVTSLALPSEISWLQPYPDSLPAVDEPDALVVARETIELAYLAAIPLLPPTQWAVLVLRDVLGWSAAETAELLDASVLADRPSIRKTRTRRHEKWRRAMAVQSGAVI